MPKFRKTNDAIPRKRPDRRKDGRMEGQMEGRKEGQTEGRTEGRKDGQTLFHRILPPTARGPKSIALSFVLNVSRKTFERYADDSHVRFEYKQKSLQFLES